jgi:protein-tyrosine phosphatase
MKTWLRWLLGTLLIALLTAVPFYYYRAQYTYDKRLREVVPGVLYRSGQMTEEGFADAVARYHIRTFINAQDEYPDPDIWHSYLNRRTIKETELCRRLGVRYVFLPPDLVPPQDVPAHHPAAIDQLLTILDDPANQPVLIHCKAGLHRTGVFVAVYRMEYDHWTPRQALAELRGNGFGEFVSSSANDYIVQYIHTYRPRETAQSLRVW